MSDVPSRKILDEFAADRENQPSHTVAAGPSVRLDDELPSTMPPDEFVADLIRECGQNDVANIGPFYDALFAGRVTLEGARIWVKQWYYDARAFPPLVAQIIANCDYYYDARQCFGANLMEELGELDPNREHPQLLKRIGKALGVSDEEMEFVQPIPELLVFTEYRHKLVRDGNFVEAVAAGALATELAIPNRYRRIGEVLAAQFEVPHDDMEFLWIHAGDPNNPNDYGGDEAHAAQATELIRKYANNAGIQDRVRLALWRSLEARKVYQWGLFRACVLELDPAFRDHYLCS